MARGTKRGSVQKVLFAALLSLAAWCCCWGLDAAVLLRVFATTAVADCCRCC